MINLRLPIMAGTELGNKITFTFNVETNLVYYDECIIRDMISLLKLEAKLLEQKLEEALESNEPVV